MNELEVKFKNYFVCLFIVVLIVSFSIIASWQPNTCPYTAALFSCKAATHVIPSWPLCRVCPLQNQALEPMSFTGIESVPTM